MVTIYRGADEHVAEDELTRIPGASLGTSPGLRKISGKLSSVLLRAGPPQYSLQLPPALGSPPQQMLQAAQYVQPECEQFGSQNAGTSQVRQAAA
jgi:hypothetical protein